MRFRFDPKYEEKIRSGEYKVVVPTRNLSKERPVEILKFNAHHALAPIIYSYIDENGDEYVSQGSGNNLIIISPEKSKFKIGDEIYSKKNPSIKYRIIQAGVVNELGEEDYEVENIGSDPEYRGRHYFMSVSKVDSWGEIEQKELGLNKFEEAVYDCAWGKVTCKVEGETKEEYAKRHASHLLELAKKMDLNEVKDSGLEEQLKIWFEKGKAQGKDIQLGVRFDKVRERLKEYIESIANPELKEYSDKLVDNIKQIVLFGGGVEELPASIKEVLGYINRRRSEKGFNGLSWEELPLEERKKNHPGYFSEDGIDCFPFTVR